MAIQSLTQSVRQPSLETLELTGASSTSRGLGLLAEDDDEDDDEDGDDDEEEEAEDVVPENCASILCRVDFSVCLWPRFRASNPA